MKAGVLIALVLSVALTVPAAAHHPTDAITSTTSLPIFGGPKRSALAKAVAQAAPVTGSGSNMQIVANVPLGVGDVAQGANDADFLPAAADIELAGDYAYIGSYVQGLVIVNISSCTDPANPSLCKPFVQGALKCSGGQFDVQLSPDSRYLVMAHEEAGAAKACHPGEEGAQIIDISNKSAPREVAFISDETSGGGSSGQVVDGAHNVTLDWPTLYIDQYTNAYPQTDVYDVATPSQPRKIGEIDFTAHGATGPHDSIPDHRPDGKDRLYAASIEKSDVIDIGNPANPQVLQSFTDLDVGTSHGAEPNHNRKTLIVTDEENGGGGLPGCGGPDPAFGAVHFYALDGNGLVPGGAAGKQGVFNIPSEFNDPDQVLGDAGCTSHVFWQAPNENRLVIAWYGRGIRVVDFSDPANPTQIGSFVPTGADTWAAKPHRGFIFTGDIVRGMDVLVYTGEGRRRWPTTSGAAEVQRAAVQGCPAKGAAGRCPAAEPAAAAAAAEVRRFVISRRSLRASRRGVVSVRMACKQATTCRGTLRLSVKRRRGAKSKRLTIARKRFAIPAGRTVGVRVKLTRRARRLLAQKRRLRVEAFAKLGQGLTGKTTFRLSAPRRR